MKKIINYDQLNSFVKQLKLKKSKLVLVGGCFDILHLGHVKFLEAAKKYGLVLVALESDSTLKKLKGLSRPIHSQLQRAEVLSNLNTVDFIILLPKFSKDADYANLTKTISPDFVAVTHGDPILQKKQAQTEKIGAKLIIVPKITTPSTSQLIKLLKLD
jgi:FAD synthetase